MKVFSVYCGYHLIGRFICKKNADVCRDNFILENDLDDYEVDVREHKI